MGFPVVAAIILCSLYLLMKKFGKEMVNEFLLFNLAIGGRFAIRSIIESMADPKMIRKYN